MTTFYGNFKSGSVVRIKFNTLNQALIPTTPSVSPAFEVYKNSVTQSTAGISATLVDYDGKAGFHSFSIDTTSDPAFYTAGEDYDVVFTAGTVDGKDLTRVKLTTFAIENRFDEVNTTKIAGQTASAAAPVTFPASVANETTVANRASQASVDAIPTNPLLTTDSRLNNLDFAISTVNNNILNLNNLSAKMNLFGSPLLEIPESGSTVYAFTLVVKDDEDKLVNLDVSPTVTAANAAGTNRSGNLSAVANPSTGRYTFTYTVAWTHASESLRIAVSGTVSAEARYVEWIGAVVNYDSLTVLQSVQTTVNAIDTRLPAAPAAVGDIPTANQNRDAVMNAMPNGGWVNGSFGDRWLIGVNNTREVAVTGSGHVASVLHDAEPNSIPEDAFQTGALSARAIGTDAIDSDALADSAKTEIANAVAALQVLSRLDSMIESDGAGQFRFDTIAVSLAAQGGGGGAVNISVEDQSITVC